MMLYHFRPPKMSGKILFPLNQLKISCPMIYENEATKYKGREHLLEKKVPLLNCLWNDVLHLSPINPQIIIDTMIQEGLYNHEIELRKDFEVFKIPLKLIIEESSVCFQSFNFNYSSENPDLEKCRKFENQNYKEQREVHPDQIRVWHEDKIAGRKLLFFSHTLHILTKSSIDTSECEVFTCSWGK